MPELTRPSTLQRNDVADVTDAAYTVANGIGVVKATKTASGTLNITLRPVAGNLGRKIYFWLTAISGGGKHTIVDAGDDSEWVDIDLDGAGDRCFLEGNGLAWITLFSELS